jgi:hypothetical protein
MVISQWLQEEFVRWIAQCMQTELHGYALTSCGLTTITALCSSDPSNSLTFLSLLQLLARMASEMAMRQELTVVVQHVLLAPLELTAMSTATARAASATPPAAHVQQVWLDKNAWLSWKSNCDM